MGILSNMAAVTEARARMAVARVETTEPAAALVAKGYEHPLTVMGMAAGVGFFLSNVKMNPLAVPGVSTLVAGGASDLVGQLVSLAAGSLFNSSGDTDP
ncbi:hypothetical protein FHW69_001162 [Luteibacter sp. Sphag1AF]|uniref:hypothetical protein n=1 Tax=Luteibacter sp. Sphag1AF TaxID=2587031 RepID=UPI001611FF14|nr:hypothetical protein [Luteibacter sp. Sphag1AF]MBB3226572.1 hypothetical protein [Luteibacter sp. Sphag1AF]